MEAAGDSTQFVELKQQIAEEVTIDNVDEGDVIISAKPWEINAINDIQIPNVIQTPGVSRLQPVPHRAPPP